MIAYVDSSVLLRLLLREPAPLREWGDLESGVTSALTRVECLRALDRHRHRGGYAPRHAESRREMLLGMLTALSVVDLSPGLLERASLPLPVPVGTLDAIHLVTALQWREASGDAIVLATHDAGLGGAARSCGLPVVGV